MAGHEPRNANRLWIQIACKRMQNLRVGQILSEEVNENRFNTRCFNAVTVVCDLNPFDSFCQYNTNYTNARPARIIACRDEVVNAPFCAEAKAFVCKDNPFDALCRLDYTMNTYATERQHRD